MIVKLNLVNRRLLFFVAVEVSLKGTALLEDNYPEILKAGIMVNSKATQFF